MSCPDARERAGPVSVWGPAREEETQAQRARARRDKYMSDSDTRSNISRRGARSQPLPCLVTGHADVT